MEPEDDTLSLSKFREFNVEDEFKEVENFPGLTRSKDALFAVEVDVGVRTFKLSGRWTFKVDGADPFLFPVILLLVLPPRTLLSMLVGEVGDRFGKEEKSPE